MKCEVIRDLLPLYVDGLTSNVTNKEIEHHLQSCRECTEVLKTMQTKEPYAPPVSEIDYLKKSRRKARNLILSSLASILLITAGLIFWRTYLTPRPLEETGIEWNLDVKDDEIRIQFDPDDRYCVYEVGMEEQDGTVHIEAEAVRKSFLHHDTAEGIYTVDSLTTISLNGHIIWDQGQLIPKEVSEVYETRHDYVGEMPANGQTALALGIANRIGPYQNELQTAEEPYSWILEFTEDIPGEQKANAEKLMKGFGYTLIAMIGNLDHVTFSWLTDGEPYDLTITAAESTAFLGQDIKACAESPALLMELMKKSGLLGEYTFHPDQVMVVNPLLSSMPKTITNPEIVSLAEIVWRTAERGEEVYPSGEEIRPYIPLDITLTDSTTGQTKSMHLFGPWYTVASEATGFHYYALQQGEEIYEMLSSLEEVPYSVPGLYLQDVLASTWVPLRIPANTYTWHQSAQTFTGDREAPFALTLKSYSHRDAGTPYVISWYDTEPDSLTLLEDGVDITGEESSIIMLKPDHTYEITAEWGEKGTTTYRIQTKNED